MLNAMLRQCRRFFSGILGGDPAGEPRAEDPRMPGDAEDAEDAEDARGT